MAFQNAHRRILSFMEAKRMVNASTIAENSCLVLSVKNAKQSGSVRPRAIYAALIAFIAEAKQQQTERGGSSGMKDSEIFYMLVFLYRMGLLRTNGRSRSRRYIEFLRSQFPQAQQLKREESRIIVP